ncbi:glyoxalase superfamily protein [Maritalea sp. S77]
MTYADHAKALAKRLRKSLKQRDIDLSHSQCLEIFSELIGEISWNI